MQIKNLTTVKKMCLAFYLKRLKDETTSAKISYLLTFKEELKEIEEIEALFNIIDANIQVLLDTSEEE